MVDDVGKRKSPARKLGSQILRERMGGIPPHLLQQSREQAAVERQIRQALRTAPMTVPELSRETGIAAHEAFWFLVALSKYGKVARQQERDGYYAYAWVTEAGKK